MGILTAPRNRKSMWVDFREGERMVGSRLQGTSDQVSFQEEDIGRFFKMERDMVQFPYREDKFDKDYKVALT